MKPHTGDILIYGIMSCKQSCQAEKQNGLYEIFLSIQFFWALLFTLVREGLYSISSCKLCAAPLPPSKLHNYVKRTNSPLLSLLLHLKHTDKDCLINSLEMENIQSNFFHIQIFSTLPHTPPTPSASCTLRSPEIFSLKCIWRKQNFGVICCSVPSFPHPLWGYRCINKIINNNLFKVYLRTQSPIWAMELHC